MAIPKKVMFGYLCDKASRSGISFTHGAHQVAQKFTTNGRPAYVERGTDSP